MGVLRARPGLALLALLACNPGPAGPSTDPAPAKAATPASAGDPWLVGTVTALGERHAFVAVVHPDRWPALHARLTALQLPPDLADPLASAADPARWLPVFLDALRPAAPAVALAPLDLTAWDRTRPVVLALGDVPVDVATGLLTATLIRPRRPAVRHEFILPATDPAALTAALAAALAPLGEPRPEFVAQHPGAHAWALGAGDTLAALPGDRLVRVRLDVGAAAPDLSPRPAAPDLSPRPAAPAAPLDLSSGPAARTTPGVLTLAADDAAALLLRPHRLPALAIVDLLRDIERARTNPAGSGPQRRATLRSLAVCEQVWGAEPSEIDDYALTLGADDRGLFARAVVSLTPRGDAAVTAGSPAEAMPLALVRPAAADAWIRFDPIAAAASTGKPLAPLASDLFLDASPECGALVSITSPTAPFAAIARIYAGVYGDAPPPSAQTAVGQLAVTDAVARKGGIASLTDPSLSYGTASAPLQQFAAMFDAEVKVEAEREGDRQRVRAGFNLAPADVFGAPAPQAGLAHVHADLLAVAPLVVTVVPIPVATLTTYRHLTGAARRSGRTVVAELALTDSDPPARPLDFTAAPWDPLPAPPEPRCAQDFARGLTTLLRPFAIESLDDIDAAADGDADTALANLAALKPALTCLAAAGLDSVHLHALAVDSVVDAFLEQHSLADATRILTAACEDSLPAACARNDALTAAPPPRLPLVETTCQDRIEPPARTLALAANHRSLDGAPIAGPAALRPAFPDFEGDNFALALAIDKDLTPADLRPWLPALADLGAAGLHLSLVVRTTGATLPVHLPLAAPLAREVEPAHTIRITGPAAALRPDDITTLEIPGPVRVAPDDAATWQTIAAALARSCDGATLITAPGAREPR